MNFRVRNFQQKDYPMLQAWYSSAQCLTPPIDIIPEDTTFIVESMGEQYLSLTLYLTNCKAVCLAENFIGNPNVDSDTRRLATYFIQDYIEEFASQLGYKAIIASTEIDDLVDYYEELGYTLGQTDIKTLGKEIQYG